MATRSSIAVKTPEGIRSIYCHYDGYPSNNGTILNENYTNPAKINRLIGLGDISYLSDNVGSRKQDFNNPQPGITLAYGRDRGETDVDAITHPDVESWAEDREGAGCEYGYLWNGNDWEVFDFLEAYSVN